MRISLESELPRLTVPIRMDVFGERPMTVGKNRKPKPVSCGWQAWNPDPIQEQKHARLSGSGSFYWAGAIKAYLAAKQILRTDPSVHQIKLETIGGKEIARLYRTGR